MIHQNGLTVRCPQIACVPRGLAGPWNRRRLAEEPARPLTVRGEDQMRHLMTHVVPLAQGSEIVTALTRREVAARQVVFIFAGSGAAGRVPTGRSAERRPPAG